MFDDEEPGEFSIADRVRAMAKEVGGSLERMLDHLELDEPAASFGIDPDRAREWAETAGTWLRAQVEGAGDELASWVAGRGSEEEPEDRDEPLSREDRPPPPEDLFRTRPQRRPGGASRPRGRGHGGARQRPVSPDPLRGAAPNALDLPTTEQGQALAALDSGRWTLEPGTEALASAGEGSGPSDALGLVRELRVRDWITAEGRLTLAGRRALGRWLDAVE
ncbi:MAG: hypothetical protein ACTHQQ_12775 [Solirubrobacteraceae bacterium]